uniref:Zinc finger and SCAN domain-containing protein 22-like n=1 Tax=Fundulus heteroclitus TaxID=8078 RepID=A0A3Q2PSQ8_FUNHE
MAGVFRQALSPSRMSKLQQLRVFVRERLSAAAEEIFGAVERTLLELENDVYVSMEAVRNTELLTSAEALTAMPDTASQELGVSEKQASQEAAEVLVKQIKPEFWDGTEYWPGQDNGTLLDLLNSEPVACLKSEQGTRTSSCFSHNGSIMEEGMLFPHASTEQLNTDGYDGSDFCQPVSSEGEAENDGSATDRSDTNADSALRNSERKAKHRQNSKKGITFFHCGTCGESFLRRSSMVMHARSHVTGFSPLCPSNSAASAQRSLEGHKVDNLCHVCGKTFTTATHLKRHMMIHTGQRPHCCKECGKTFARGECLRIHMRIHTVERPYMCKVCPKSFRQRSNLVTHMRMHTGEKPYHCSICSQPFTYKKDMNKHMQSHSLTT